MNNLGFSNVIIREHPFAQERKELDVIEGITLNELLKQCQIPAWTDPMISVNGRIQKTLEHVLRARDQVLVTVVPQASAFGNAGQPGNTNSSTSPFGPVGVGSQPQQQGGKNVFGGLFGGLIGAGALALNWFLSNTSTTRSADRSAIDQNPLVEFYDPPQPTFTPYEFVGGQKDRLLPQITGVANRINKWGELPYVAGQYRMYPVIVALPFTYVSGKDQYIVGVVSTGYGETEISDIKIGDTLASDLAASGVEINVRTGTSTDQPLQFYTNDPGEVQVATQLLYNQPVTKRGTQECTRLSLTLQYDAGGFQIVTHTRPDRSAFQTREPVSVSFLVEYKLASAGSWTTYGSVPWGVNSESTERYTLAFDVPQGIYDVRVTRQTPDATSNDVVMDTSWASLQSIRNVQPINVRRDRRGQEIYIGKIEFRVKASDQNNGVLRELSCTVKHKVRTWNGSSWTNPVVTSNPAWILCDILTGKAFDSQVDETELDIAAIYAWALFCEEKGYRFNAIFDSGTEITDVLQQVTAAGRAALLYRDGKYTVVVDKEQSTVAQHFCTSNARNYAFKKIWPIIPNALRCQFQDETNEYQTAERIVYADGYNESSTEVIYQDLPCPGVTNPEQVFKLARYTHAVMRLRPITHEITVDPQHAVCNLGDLVMFAHDVPKIGLSDGQIIAVQTDGSGNITHLNVNNAVVMEAGKSYNVRIRLSDNTSLVRSLVTLPGESYSMQFQTPIPVGWWSVKPQGQDQYMFGEPDKEASRMIVVSIEHEQNQEARITMVDYSPAIFNADTDPIPPFNPNISDRHEAQIILPKAQYWNVQSDEEVLIEHTDGAKQARIVISMSPPNDYRVTHFQYQFKRADSSDSSWGPLRLVAVSQGKISIEDVVEGVTYKIQVRCYREPGIAGEWTPIPDHTVIGYSTKPPDIAQLVLSTNGKRVEALPEFWPRDFLGFRWKFHRGDNSNWLTADTLKTLTTEPYVDIESMPKGIMSIGVVMVDIAGNESQNPRWIKTNLGDLTQQNIYKTVNFHPTFPGSITNGVISLGVLKATDNGANMWGPDDNAPRWKPDENALVWSGLTYNPLTYIFEWVPDFSLAGLPYRLLLRPGHELLITAESYHLYYRTFGTNLRWNNQPDGDDLLIWNSDSGTLMWTADSPWQIWPDELQVNGSVEKFEFMLLCDQSSRIETAIPQLQLVADMPDLEERIASFVVNDSAGVRCSPTKPFKHIEIVNITIGFDAAYPNAHTAMYLDTALTPGPLIRVFDAAGNPTTGKVNLWLQGW